jgi:hypothetical protein
LDALIKIEVDSNAHVSALDNNSPNPDRFQPRVASDSSLTCSMAGWVQFSITFIKDNSYLENDPSTDADDAYSSRSLSGLRYQHYDVDGYVNGSGSGAGYFREIGCITGANNVFTNEPSGILDDGYYAAGGWTWRKMLGETQEHAGISSDQDVTFTATFGAVSVIRFRLGFVFEKGNGGSAGVADREYATEFSCLGFAQPSTLPVQLLSFTGNYHNQATQLNWETENEQNFDHFEIERSNSGSSYARIGSKLSMNGSGRQSYQFTDDLAQINGVVFYYRLKIVDKDGQFRYSNIIMIRKESKAIRSIVLNPNPVVNGMANLRLTTSRNDVVTLRVMDMNGRVVAQQENKVYEGNNSISISNLDRLQAGVYLLQLANNDELTTIKFNIAR